jgi:hypothetical protein
MNPRRWNQVVMAGFAIVVGLQGCSTPKKLSDAELESIGLRNGVKYWDAQRKLAQRGYSCFVGGAKRETFDCTRYAGTFPTCLLRVEFVADDMNVVSGLTVRDPACMGTP